MPVVLPGDADSEFTIYTLYQSMHQKKQPKKCMICKFGKWDSLFSAFDQSDHLAKCDAFDKARKLEGKTSDCFFQLLRLLLVRQLRR